MGLKQRMIPRPQCSEETIAVDAGPDLDSRTLALRRSIRRGAAEQRDENAPSQVEHGLPPAKGATSINISTREFAAARWKRASPWRARTARYRALGRPLATEGIRAADSTRPSQRGIGRPALPVPPG